MILIFINFISCGIYMFNVDCICLILCWWDLCGLVLDI